MSTAPNTARRGPNRLIRVLAHDLRNPISGILAASQCLIEDASPVLDSQQMTLLRSIESSSDLMLRLIEDMLEVAQAESIKSRLRLQRTDVSRLLDHTAAIYRPMAEAKNIRLTVRRNGVVPPIDLDPGKITQALNALLGNVVRCAPPCGQIELDVMTRPKRVVIAGSHVGPGEATKKPETNSLHRRGSQEASTLTLAAVRLIVEGHGGTVRVQKSAINPAFTLALPRSRGSEAASERSAPKVRTPSVVG
jgi:K+-sensing histidine kinase KdpD